jgi:hypothetical protein
MNLTDKLAKSRGPLEQQVQVQNRNEGTSLDCLYIFFLTFSLLIMLLEPLFIFIWQFI